MTDMGFPSLYPAYGGEGEYDGATVVLPTTDTGYRSYSKGRLFLPAGTNYCVNPASETAYTASDGSLTCTLETNPPVPLPAGFTKCTKCVHNDTGDYSSPTICTTGISVTPGETYTLSAYVHLAARTGVESINLGFNYLQGATQRRQWYTGAGNCSVSAVNDSFVRISCSSTVAADEDTMWFTAVNGDATSTSYITGIQCEKSAYPTPYFDGSMDNCAWTGTSNASTSTRAVSGFRVNGSVFGGNSKGTIAGRFDPLFVYASVPALVAFYANDNCWEVGFYPAVAAGNIGYASITQNGGAYQETAVIGDHAPGTPESVVIRWIRGMGTTLDLISSGVAGTKDTSPELLAEAIDTVMLAGYGGYIGPLALCPYRITDAEAVILDGMLAANCSGSDLYKWFKQKGYGGTMILPLEGDSRGYIVPGGQADNYTYTEADASADTGYEVYDG